MTDREPRELFPVIFGFGRKPSSTRDMRPEVEIADEPEPEAEKSEGKASTTGTTAKNS